MPCLKEEEEEEENTVHGNTTIYIYTNIYIYMPSVCVCAGPIYIQLPLAVPTASSWRRTLSLSLSLLWEGPVYSGTWQRWYRRVPCYAVTRWRLLKYAWLSLRCGGASTVLRCTRVYQHFIIQR